LAGVVRTAPGRLTACAALAFALLSLAVWNAPQITTAEPLYIALFIAVGAPGVALMTGLVTTLQEASAEGQRGKVFAIARVAASVGEATGMIAAGVLGDRFGLTAVLDAQAALYLVAGVIAAASTAGAGRTWRRRSAPSAATGRAEQLVA